MGIKNLNSNEIQNDFFEIKNLKSSLVYLYFNIKSISSEIILKFSFSDNRFYKKDIYFNLVKLENETINEYRIKLNPDIMKFVIPIPKPETADVLRVSFENINSGDEIEILAVPNKTDMI